MLFATRIEPIIAAARSGQVELVTRIVDWFRTNLDDPSPATLEMVEREAKNLLGGNMKGRPESEDHVYIISALAEVLGVQTPDVMIADGTWKQSAWYDYYDGIKLFIDEVTRDRYGQLALCKRPIFGSRIDTNWAYYGYLFNNEAQQLYAGLARIAIAHPEIASASFVDGFHNELVGWLRHVVERKTDLWLFAS